MENQNGVGFGWGRLVHVNTWPWSRAVEPGGRVGALPPPQFLTPKKCLFKYEVSLSKHPRFETMLRKRTLS